MIQSAPPDQALIGFIASIAGLTALFMYGFYTIVARDRELRSREHSLDKKASETIERSHKKAHDILSEAVDNAKSILADTKTFKHALEEDLTSTLDHERDEYKQILDAQLSKTSGVYEQVLKEVAIYYKQAVKDAAEKLKKTQQQHEDDYKHMISDESLSAKFYIQRRVNEELDKANKEIQEYKQSELEHMKQRFETLINDISEQIFEGSLTQDQHQELIRKALEEAKKNNIFSS